MTSKPSNAAAHAFAAFGFITSPITALYLDHHFGVHMLATIAIQAVLVLVLWRALLRKPTKVVPHSPIALPHSMTLGSGTTRIHCDREGIRLGPDALTAAFPVSFNEDVLLFQKNRYEMFIAWIEVATLLDMNRHAGTLQIVYCENPYKGWVAFQPPSLTQEEHTLLRAFILQGGQNPVN